MTHFRWTLRVVFLLGAILARASQASAAPVVFDATGDFNGVVGETVLSGTVTIDTATGKVVSADLKVEEGGTTLIFDQFRSVAVVGSGSLQSVAITVDGYNEKSRAPVVLQLAVPHASLVDYAGGILKPYRVNAPPPTTYWYAPKTGGIYGPPINGLIWGSLKPQ